MTYPHLFARLYNTPLLLLPEKARIIEAVFRTRLAGEQSLLVAGSAEDESRQERPVMAAGLRRVDSKPYPMSEGGVAVIPVMGTLVQRASGLDAMSGLMSYGRVGALLSAAIGDADVRGILLEIDSPGGEVYGLFDLVDTIRASRDAKPVWASANEMAYSAAYAIASAAQRMSLPRTAGVGSVGVIALHVEQSKRDAAQGYVYTPVFAGARKNDLSAHEPISKAAQSALQLEVDRLYDIFVAAVAQNRALDESVPRDTQAALLNPDEAIKLGMADEIASFSDTLGMLEEHVKQSAQSVFLPAASQAVHSQELLMSTDKNAPGSGAQPDTAALEAAAHARGLSAGQEQGRKEGASAERARISGILTSTEAQGRNKQATALALETELSVEAANKVLAASPKESVAAANPFAAAMAGVPNPAIPAGSTQPAADGDVSAQVAALAASVISAGKAKAAV